MTRALRPARRDEPGDIAGARAQVVHLAGLGEIHAAQEIDGGTETVVGEPQMLRWDPRGTGRSS